MSVAQLLAAADPGAAWPPYAGNAARGLPAVGRALSLYVGLIKQMPLGRFRGIAPLPTTRLLEAPDPQRSGAWFVGRHVDDYLMHGNAIHYVTSWDADDWPATAVWLPAQRVGLVQDPTRPFQRPEYFLDGTKLDLARVVHVQRAADPSFPWRGVGVLEQHLRSLSRVYTQESYEQGNISGSGVPSVVIVAPNQHLSDDEINASLGAWEDRYTGPVRKPAILPNGSVVTPLAWSPSDSQLNEARTLSLTDVANMFSLDGYWLGAPSSGLNYKSPGPMFTTLVRTSIGPVCAELEQGWGAAWLPRTQRLRFDRTAIENDTLPALVPSLAQGMATIGVDGLPMITTMEARAKLGLAVTGASLAETVPSALPTTGEGE